MVWLCGLQESKGQGLTINVEYNQLETLVKTEDTDAQGYSVFPGNINVLILAIPTVGTTHTPHALCLLLRLCAQLFIPFFFHS